MNIREVPGVHAGGILPIAKHLRAVPRDDVRQATWSANCPIYFRDGEGNLVRAYGPIGHDARRVAVAGEA
jgi:hypothetical protein